MKTALMIWLQGAVSALPGKLRSFGPYFLVELILPGGSLLALLLWLYNHRQPRA